MQLYFFGGLENLIPRHVLAEVSQIIPDENIEIFATVVELGRRLREIEAHPDIFVLTPANHDEIMSLLSIQELFGQIPIVLVLPDQRPETVQYGHLLQPRFLTFGESNLSEVGAVIDKIKTRATTQSEAVMDLQQRSLWAILVQCPFFAGPLVDCPLNKYRDSLDLEQKFQFSIDHPLSTVKAILKTHQQCFAKRQEDWLAKIPESPLPEGGECL